MFFGSLDTLDALLDQEIKYCYEFLEFTLKSNSQGAGGENAVKLAKFKNLFAVWTLLKLRPITKLLNFAAQIKSNCPPLPSANFSQLQIPLLPGCGTDLEKVTKFATQIQDTNKTKCKYR